LFTFEIIFRPTADSTPRLIDRVTRPSSNTMVANAKGSGKVAADFEKMIHEGM
jgi:hypothetical protein